MSVDKLRANTAEMSAKTSCQSMNWTAGRGEGGSEASFHVGLLFNIPYEIYGNIWRGEARRAKALRSMATTATTINTSTKTDISPSA